MVRTATTLAHDTFITMATGTDDPVRYLNNYLLEVKKGENLTAHLRFTSQQMGPNSQAVHTVTCIFRGVTVGTGVGTTKSTAKYRAAAQALEYFKANGICE